MSGRRSPKTVVVPKNYGLIRKPRRIRLDREPVRRRRTPWLGAVLVVAAVVGVAVVVAVTKGGSNAAIPPEQAVDSYRVIYRVEAPGAPAHEEERDIMRPFLGRFIERSAGVVTTGFLTANDSAWAWTNSGAAPGWVPAQDGVSRATADQHAAAALAAGGRYGLAKVRGTKRVLGRQCVEVRTGAPAGQPLSKPTGADHADLCVDRTGVVLTEQWIRGGKAVRTRTATSFTIGPAFDGSTFQPSPTGDPTLAGSTLAVSTHPVSDKERAGLGFSFTPPPGYVAAGPLTARAGLSNGATPAAADFIQYYRNGSDLLDVVQGTQPPRGVPVTIPGLGRAYLNLDMTASSVEVAVASGRTVKIEGGDPRLLLDAATRLRAAGSG